MERQGFFDEAGRLTATDRAAVYGDNLTNHTRIAALWSQVLGIEVQPYQVPLCMALLKVARLIQTPNHEDSWIDGVAYLGLAGELACAPSE